MWRFVGRHGIYRAPSTRGNLGLMETVKSQALQRALDIAAAVAELASGIGSEAEVADLVLATSGAGHPAPVGKHPVGEGLKVSEPIVKRARVLAKLYARLAEEDAGVQSAREDIAQDLGRLPTIDELPQWLDRFRSEAWDPALRDTEWDDPERAKELDGLGVERPTLPDGRRRTVTFAHPTGGDDFQVPSDTWCGTVARTIAKLVDDYPWRQDHSAMWLICGSPIPMVVNATFSQSNDGVSLFSMGIDYRISDGEGSRPATPAELKRMAERERPGTDTRWRVTMTVDPAISPAEVAQLYARVRATIAPTRVVPLADKTLALASFVLDQPEDPFDAPGALWDRWLTQWNRGPGRTKGWRYSPTTSDRWNFRRDARSALDRVRYTGWHLPGR